MNLTLLASEIASRVPEMARDSAINNSMLIERMIAEYIARETEREKVVAINIIPFPKASEWTS